MHKFNTVIHHLSITAESVQAILYIYGPAVFCNTRRNRSDSDCGL